MVVHWDDVPARPMAAGEVRADWQDLGRAAGSVTVGMRRQRVHPGARASPVHRHHGEEEIAYVLGGSGVVWRDGATYEVAAGDVVLEPPAAHAHAFVAGEDGLEVLVFGPRLATEVGELPRAGVARIGSSWFEVAGGARGLEREASAGPLELPAAPSPRPPTILAVSSVTGDARRRGATNIVRRNLGEALGSVTTGMRTLEIAPRARSYPHHCHSAEEELFVVLEGSGRVRLGDEKHEVGPGHVLARPAGTGIAHSFWADDDGLVVLAYGTRDGRDVCYYPDSRKILVNGIVFRVEPVDYWDGEE